MESLMNYHYFFITFIVTLIILKFLILFFLYFIMFQSYLLLKTNFINLFINIIEVHNIEIHLALNLIH